MISKSRQHKGKGSHRSAGSAIALALPADVEALPTVGVEQFIRLFAAKHGVTYQRTALSDWAEAVTANSGDDVKTDAVKGLLIALSQRDLLSDDQFIQLTVNLRRERLSLAAARTSP